MAMWRIARIGLVVAVVLAILAGAGWHLYGGSWKAQYEARVAALRAAGQPTRLEDLATPPIPDDENAATLLEQAHRVLEERMRAPGNAEHLLGTLDRDDAEHVELKAYLDSLAPYFDLLARVPDRPGWRLDLDWSDGIATRMDYFGQINEARTYVIARLETDDEESGRTERAARAATLFLGLSARCRGPFLLGHLAAEQVAAEPAHILRIAMRQPGFDAALFRRIVDPALARSIPERGPPRRVLVEERAFGIAAVEAIADSALSVFQRPRLYRSGEYMLDLAEKAIARCETAPENAIAVADEIAALPVPKDEWFGTSGRMYSQTFRVFADHVAGRRLARVVMALLERRQRDGKWPESLASLGEMPTDPHGGSPFLYERKEHGCKVRCAKEDTDEELEDRDLLWVLDDDQIPAMAR